MHQIIFPSLRQLCLMNRSFVIKTTWLCSWCGSIYNVAQKKNCNGLTGTNLHSSDLKLMAYIAFKITLGKEAEPQRQPGVGPVGPRWVSSRGCPLQCSRGFHDHVNNHDHTLFFPQKNNTFHRYLIKIHVGGLSLIILLALIE